MTYCVSMNLDAGLVFLSDSRTNAGVDHINTFRKMSIFERPGERVMVLMSSGNLAITQQVVSVLKEAMLAQDGRESLWSAPNMFEAARHVGEILREVYRRDSEAFRNFGIDFAAALILGGQIGQEQPRLFHIYAAGNFIEATPDTPYFQIGESKYGKPIIDRVVNRHTSLDEAAKLALISMDSTIRSNLSVGVPLDLAIIRTDELKVSTRLSIDSSNAYFQMIRSRWSASLRDAFDALPNPDWQDKGEIL
ncbi:proteasome-type protease [Zoogloea sp.]|uniref:proteasome-type protease n=1 Tax=Zoogloea sp. TaxID=49181 RepID=UPI002617E6C5|nr:proteasome-type protease [Zoogloea sp.]MDD3354092.1 proteasome-type protease [Zoogloea sp.]